MSTTGWLWAVAGLGALACACGSDATQPAPPDLAQCRDAWVSLMAFEGRSGDAPDVLRWDAGKLYFQDWGASPPRIVALADGGGELAEVTQDVSQDFWIEGDALWTAQLDQLYSVPVSGGSRTLVRDGGLLGSGTYMGQRVSIKARVLDASFMYWALRRYTTAEWTLWRLGRAEGSTDEQLAVLPEPIDVRALVPLPDQLLVAGAEGDSYVLPSDGGDVQALPTVASSRARVMWSRHIGAAESGIVWAVANQYERGKLAAAYDTLLATPDGDLRVIWQEKPAELVPDHAWTDAAGGWVISGSERFSDGERHTSLWHVDARDHATRLACDARAGNATGYPGTAAVAPDAVYLVVQYFEGAASARSEGGWALVKVAR